MTDQNLKNKHPTLLKILTKLDETKEPINNLEKHDNQSNIKSRKMIMITLKKT